MSTSNVLIQPLEPHHWESVREIYLEGIATRNATFEIDAPTWEEWNAQHLSFGRVVALRIPTVVGWAALSPVSRRTVYRGVAEVSLYVAGKHRGQGIGRLLLNELIRLAEDAGIWTLQAAVFPENVATLRLHAGAGFRRVGYRERIGQLDGIWRDTILLERRSRAVGHD
jgi:phosphinothricin acetyltransferase